MKPSVWISRITFSDGSVVEMDRSDVVIIVGPNNGGKSETLRAIAGKLADADRSSPVVRAISYQKEGSHEEVVSWLQSMTWATATILGEKFQLLGKFVERSHIEMWWKKERGMGSSLSGFFCTLLNAEERLGAANPPDNVAITIDGPKHPIHFLQWNDSVEKRISDYFERAFGTGIVVHRNAGKIVPILVGKAPQVQPGKDRQSIEYVRDLEKLPPVQTQGDGMRSFLGVLLFTAVGSEPILLIDEPEAFLHPPQARHLGDFLVNETGAERQLFVATHSGDVLRGALDSENHRVRVLRLRREGDVNIARELSNAQISQLWSDSLLRYSNILDGLFHERVILCESDSDCRFYSAITDAIFESGGDRRPDIMFTHCGGKQRLPLIIRSLRGLEVPISIVTDFDVLNAESPLMEIVEAAGGQWKDVKPDWKVVKKAIDDKKPELSTGEVRREIESALSTITGHVIPEATKKTIQDALRASSPWSTAKSVGIAFVPSGDASQAAKNLMNTLERLGIFVVPVGEAMGQCGSPMR
jgi:energy-coupling factor transporter ATP-binding protein EcfA2